MKSIDMLLEIGASTTEIERILDELTGEIQDLEKKIDAIACVPAWLETVEAPGAIPLAYTLGITRREGGWQIVVITQADKQLTRLIEAPARIRIDATQYMHALIEELMKRTEFMLQAARRARHGAS